MLTINMVMGITVNSIRMKMSASDLMRLLVVPW